MYIGDMKEKDIKIYFSPERMVFYLYLELKISLLSALCHLLPVTNTVSYPVSHHGIGGDLKGHHFILLACRFH